MIFELSEEHLAVREAAREFAQKELKPGVIERDRNMTFPAEQVKAMAELGFLGMMTDPQYGGGGMDTLSYVIAMEEISKIDNSCSVLMSVNNSLVCWGIQEYGTEAQKAKYLPKLATGEWIGSFCLSEPEAGSDATSQRTTAEDRGDHYAMPGKQHKTNTMLPTKTMLRCGKNGCNKTIPVTPTPSGKPAGRHRSGPRGGRPYRHDRHGVREGYRVQR